MAIDNDFSQLRRQLFASQSYPGRGRRISCLHELYEFFFQGRIVLVDPNIIPNINTLKRRPNRWCATALDGRRFRFESLGIPHR